jgi:hypothetical protein
MNKIVSIVLFDGRDYPIILTSVEDEITLMVFDKPAEGQFCTDAMDLI